MCVFVQKDVCFIYHIAKTVLLMTCLIMNIMIP